VLVDAALMKKSVASTGHVSLYDLHFATNKADLLPASAGTLAEVAKLLGENAALKLHVVGHTDNVGAVEANLELSERRAKAVVKALVESHGVEAARLRAFGVGPLAPVAPTSRGGPRQEPRVSSSRKGPCRRDRRGDRRPARLAPCCGRASARVAPRAR
jgi:outer membrane protein OmpA-like peptidoglycan-associated protein